jgi:hypothetical protein
MLLFKRNVNMHMQSLCFYVKMLCILGFFAYCSLYCVKKLRLYGVNAAISTIKACRPSPFFKKLKTYFLYK